uniref:Trefoil factor 2 n=1 Tax=Canis lupus familiaris TaxID=9615 RepID=A0A8C0P6N0_CANLF
MDMGPRGLQLLAVLLALGLCAPAGAQKPSACQCSRIEASHRKNCGFPGISAAECFNTGCCFDSRVPNVPWCFHPLPKQESEQCVMEVAARKNCGYPGISPQECASRNCCFSDTIRNVPWCFFPILNQGNVRAGRGGVGVLGAGPGRLQARPPSAAGIVSGGSSSEGHSPQ